MARTVTAMAGGHERWLAQRHAAGLKAAGGRPRKLHPVARMAEQAKRHLVERASELEAELPVDVVTAPIESLEPPEALGRATLSGIHQLIRIIEQPLDMSGGATALKQQRLIGDLALGAGKLFMRVAEDEFQRRKSDGLREFLKRLNQARAAEGAAEREAARNGAAKRGSR
jgi:hypothetical protein